MKKIFGTFFLVIFFVSVKAQTVSLGGLISNFELLDDAKVLHFNVPLTIKATDVANLSFPDTFPAFVQIGGTSDAKYCNGINFKFDKNKSSLALAVTLDSLPIQGIYSVNIRYTTNKATDKVKTYSHLSFNVVRPAATLESLNTVTITDEQFSDLKADPITIHETSNHTPVSDLKFYDPVIQGQKTDGLLIFNKDSTKIGRSDQKNFRYKVDPNVLKGIDYGTYTGKLYFSSKMLNAPVPVILTVIRRLWKGWIIFTVIAGLIVGYLIRQLLSNRRDSEMVRLVGLQLVADIAAFQKTIKASQTEENLRNYTVNILSIIKTNFFAVIPNSTNALEEIKEVQNNFNNEQKTFHDLMDSKELEFTKLSNILKNPEIIPDTIRYITPAFALLPNFVEAFKTNDFDKVERNLNAVYGAFDSGFTGYRNYFSTVTAYLTDSNSYPKVAPVTTTKIIGKVNLYAAALQSATFNRTTPDAVTLETALLVVNDNQKNYDRLPDNIRDNLLLEFINTKKTQPDTQLTNAINSWVSLLQAIVENKEMEPDADSYVSAAFHANNNIISDVDDVWNAIKPEEELDTLGGGGLKEDDIKKTKQSTETSTIGLNNVTVTPININVELAKARKNFFRLNLLRSFLLAILIGLGAYKSLEAGFIGHLSEFIGIFLFAFSLDISVANVVQFKANAS